MMTTRPSARSSSQLSAKLWSSAVHRAASFALYALLLALYWPILRYGLHALDDRSQFAFVANKAAGDLFGLDQFGHFRPVKNFLFSFVAGGGAAQLVQLRALMLTCFLGTVALVQVLAGHVLGSRWVALIATAVWALNPCAATVNAWLSASNVTVSALGVMLYMVCGVRALAESRMTPVMWTVFGHLGLVLALGAHQLAVVAPLVLFALHRLRAEPNQRRRTFSFFAASLTCLVIYLVAYALHYRPLDYRSQGLSGAALALSSARALLENAGLWIVPFDRFGVLLTFAATSVVQDLGAWFMLLALTILGWRVRKTTPVLSWSILWSVLFLGPLCNVVPLGNPSVALHYPYIAGVGLSLGLALALSRLAYWPSRPTARFVHAVGFASLVALVSLWVIETRAVVHAWRDDESVFLATHANYPTAIEPMVNLSGIYLQRQDYDRAAEFLSKARSIAPSNAEVLRNCVTVHMAKQRYADALADVRRLPNADAPENLVLQGIALLRLERHLEAVAMLERARAGAQRPSDDYSARYWLMIGYLQTQRRPDAEALLDQLVHDYPERADRDLALARRLLARP